MRYITAKFVLRHRDWTVVPPIFKNIDIPVRECKVEDFKSES